MRFGLASRHGNRGRSQRRLGISLPRAPSEPSSWPSFLSPSFSLLSLFSHLFGFCCEFLLAVPLSRMCELCAQGLGAGRAEKRRTWPGAAASDPGELGPRLCSCHLRPHRAHSAATRQVQVPPVLFLRDSRLHCSPAPCLQGAGARRQDGRRGLGLWVGQSPIMVYGLESNDF